MPRDLVDPWDCSQSYVLPEHVRANIPLRGSLGSLGAHNVARGLLVEICRATAATPAALHYAEAEPFEEATGIRAVLVTITATATLLDGTSVVVTTRNRQHPYDDRDDDWTIQLDGTPLTGESRRYPPSPRFQGRLVAWTLIARRRR
jgi:hypothetical protein